MTPFSRQYAPIASAHQRRLSFYSLGLVSVLEWTQHNTNALWLIEKGRKRECVSIIILVHSTLYYIVVTVSGVACTHNILFLFKFYFTHSLYFPTSPSDCNACCVRRTLFSFGLSHSLLQEIEPISIIYILFSIRAADFAAYVFWERNRVPNAGQYFFNAASTFLFLLSLVKRNKLALFVRNVRFLLFLPRNLPHA